MWIRLDEIAKKMAAVSVACFKEVQNLLRVLYRKIGNSLSTFLS